MPANTPTGLIALVAAELQTVAPTGFGEQDSAKHGHPRRYVWIPVDSPLRGPQRSSKSGEHVVDGIALRFAVECWGYSYDDAFYLFCALLTAIQRAWGGRNYVANTLTPWEQRQQDKGFVLALQVEIALDIVAVDLSQPPPAKPAKAYAFKPPPADGPPLPPDPEPVYGPTGETTVTITAVAPATPIDETPGDGVLGANEEP